MIAYICEQGAKIRREGERLLVWTQNGERTLFSSKLTQLILFGNVHLTAQARSLLLGKRIDTVFLDSRGEYRGRLVTDDGENVFLRKKQYDKLNDADFQLRVASAIVNAKLHNQASMLERMKLNQHLPEAGRGIAELKDLQKKVQDATTIASVRGMEGVGANIWFHHYADAFHTDWGFHGRKRRPPTDPVNAALSFVYTLLVERCLAACHLAGLDPFPANLHTLEYGRHSLPLDLVEEFRTLIGDALVLSLFNKKIFTKEDFGSRTGGNPASQGICLQGDGIKKVLRAFAAKMETVFHNPHLNREMNWTEAIRHQAGEYRRAVEEDQGEYKPLMWRRH